MPAVYPTGYTSFPALPATMDVAPTHMTNLQQLRDEMAAVQTTGGLSPQGSDASIRARLDRIDGKVTNWATYTPVLGGTGWSLGTTGSSANSACCVTNNVVHFWSSLTFGTVGATFGASPNVVTVSLPYTANANQITYHGRGSLRVELRDVSAGQAFEGLAQLDATYAIPLAMNVAGAYLNHVEVSSTVPFVWAAGDIIRMSGWYRKA